MACKKTKNVDSYLLNWIFSLISTIKKIFLFRIILIYNFSNLHGGQMLVFGRAVRRDFQETLSMKRRKYRKTNLLEGQKIMGLPALSHLCSGQEKNVHTLSFSKGLISQCSAPGQLYLYSSAEKWKGKFRDIFSLLLSCNGHSFDLVRIFTDGSWDLRTLRTFWIWLRIA